MLFRLLLLNKSRDLDLLVGNCNLFSDPVGDTSSSGTRSRRLTDSSVFISLPASVSILLLCMLFSISSMFLKGFAVSRGELGISLNCRLPSSLDSKKASLAKYESSSESQLLLPQLRI